LQSVTSYSEFEEKFQRDLALLPANGVALSQLLTFVFGDPATNPLSAIQNQVTSTDKFTQEFRLVSPQDQTLEWLLGIYYTHEDSGIDQVFTGVNAGTETPAAGIPTLATGKIPSTYEEIAVFANTTWHITSKFDLSLGARQSRNDQEASQ